MKVIAVIPARRESKRLEGKNWREFAGKPLINWTIEQAIDCCFINEIIITTDAPEIIDIVQEFCFEPRIILLKRPKEICQDDTPMKEVILHVIKERRLKKEDILILLQPTSPLRLAKDISEAYRLFKKYNVSLVPVFREDEFHYKLNGSLFIYSVGMILKRYVYDRNFIGMYIMPKERSIDIDTLNDFIYAENIMLERLKNGKGM